MKKNQATTPRTLKRKWEMNEDCALGFAGFAEGGEAGSDTGADVGPHDHPDGLGEIHEAGRNEADQQDGCHRGRLDDGGDDCTGEDCGEAVGGELGEDLTHPVACGFLESPRHQFDAEQKEGETSEEAHHNRAEGKGGRGFCENEQHGRNSSAIHGVT